MRRTTLLLGASLLALTSAQAFAADVSAAVAANFTKPAEELGAAFTAKTGDTVSFSFGATGALYTQISQGAPFEVFLSADNKRPAQAVKEGFAVDGTVFTYAVGKVVLYSPSLDLTDGAAVLTANGFQHLSVADPKTAPYGAAAMETLDKLGLTEAVTPKIVTGENISQALQFIDSANAELGFVALSQVIDKPASQVWRVPAEDYSPILQDAVLLKPGESDPAAAAFLEFLKGDEARAIIEKYGYEVGSGQ
ncbi:molybdate ABC transporter substrate-binding protein [Devosia sp. Root413D1]|uniref:molybdate ABC transporter substrate-binding protein n=1 Tax=unclassified Devosia TaxID=196773 RepID=UPI00070110FB|nr:MULTISPECIES: molybdate ABC transporter substrate-binding protein [unclassified Devosia]KQU95743.1 molybdate ABC transporter substrate-binding protein [Devosia sp. Root105]KQW78120.1 molybdate ABC transporter substrate-binding protein [Devosia sp. Root413D1]